MADLNKVLLIGRLGADPEPKKTGTGTSVARLRLATGRYRKTDNEVVKETDWHDVVTFGDLADTCCEYLRKGREVFIEGRMSADVWTDKEGKRRLTREVIAQRVDFLDKRPDAQAAVA
ncbi:MAG: single-stranded DNA-binding protein [Myxococcales bacterium]|nr:single-stranded DNA-binding protein [Myxococcales bacterium]